MEYTDNLDVYVNKDVIHIKLKHGDKPLLTININEVLDLVKRNKNKYY